MIAAVETSLARLRVTYLAPAQRAGRDFWRWWRRELLALLPESVQSSVAERNESVFVQVSGEELAVFRGSIERMQEVCRLSRSTESSAPSETLAGAREVVLLLPADQVLETIATLPSAAEENLAEVLAFEMDRLTPFTEDQVYYGFDVVGRAPAEHTIDVRLLVSPRRIVDDLLGALQRGGLLPTMITTKSDDGQLTDIDLLPKRRSRRRNTGPRSLRWGLAALLFVLLTASVVIPLTQKKRLIEEMEPQVTAAMRSAQEGSRLKRSIELFATGSAELVALRESRPAMVAIIDEISRVLPDDTWLTRIDITGAEIQIQGQSKSAASLIGLIEESPSLENARFRSPVTQAANSDAESFHLSAEWSSEQ